MPNDAMSKLFSQLNEVAQNQQAALNNSEAKTIESSDQTPPAEQKEKANILANKQVSKQTSLQACLHKYLLLKANMTVTYRFPESLITYLEDVQYRAKGRYKKRLTKNAIVNVALAHILWDLEHNQKESILYKQLIAPELRPESAERRGYSNSVVCVRIDSR